MSTDLESRVEIGGHAVTHPVGKNSVAIEKRRMITSQNSQIQVKHSLY
jgi:hypothetical protein